MASRAEREPLSVSQCTEMTQALWGESPAELEALIVGKTDGNPLFVEELSRSLVESRVLHQEAGKTVLQTPLMATGRMIMDSVEFHREPPANLTTLVVGFGGWVNAGRAATGAIRHLVRYLSASHLASLDPEAFFIFTQQRPDVRMTTEGHRAIRWPRSEFYTWQPPDGRAGLLLFWGREPNQRWRTYSQTLLDVAEQCGVKRIVSLGAVLAGAPHTRPSRVTGRSTDPEWQAQLEEWGIYRRPSYEGPTGISTVVLDAATRRGLTSLSFSGQAPHYLQGRENPAVIQALLSYVTRLLGLGLDVSEFDAAVKAFCSQCDRAVARDASIQAHVRELEQDYDSTDDEGPRALRDEDLDSDQLMQEVEDFLREDRESGGEV